LGSRVGLEAGAAPAVARAHALACQKRQRALLGLRAASTQVDRGLAEGLAVEQQRNQQAGACQEGKEDRQQTWTCSGRWQSPVSSAHGSSTSRACCAASIALWS